MVFLGFKIFILNSDIDHIIVSLTLAGEQLGSSVKHSKAPQQVVLQGLDHDQEYSCQD